MRISNSRIKITLVFIFVFISSLATKADVSITMPTGGQNISVDKAAAGTSPANIPGNNAGYTNLGDIVITAGTANDFQISGARTITFDRPTGWRFEQGVGVGNIPFTGPNITAASITAVTATRITVRYTASGAAALGNSITITGIRVQPISTNAALNPTGNITRTGGTATIAGLALSTPVATLSKVAAAYEKLQVLLPGQVAAPATLIGRTNAVATAQNAGAVFSVTVNAVDEYFNVITTAPNDEIEISSVFNGVMPANQTLSSGTRSFNVSIGQSGTNRTITATNVTDNTKGAVTSSGLTINVGALKKLLVILPGETYAPGSATGKTGTASPITVNTNFSVVVRGVDDNWNTVTTANDVVTLTTTDPTGTFSSNNLVLVSGVRTFNNARLRTAGNIHTITATYSNNLAITAYTTGPINVIAGSLVKLVLIMPGETEQQGIPAGKSGLPSTVTAGVPVLVKVNGVDANGNIVTSATDEVSFVATNDVYAVLPANAALVNGTLSVYVTFRTAGNSRRLTAKDATNTGVTSNQSAAFQVIPGAFSQLLVTVPGETYTPGSPTGNLGAKANQGINVQFSITIRAVDNAWNLINTSNDIVAVTSSDGIAVLPSNPKLVNGVKTGVVIRLRTPGFQTITATVVGDASKNFTTSDILVVGPSNISNHFRSVVATGNWNNSSSWESSADGNTWQPASLSPTFASNTITVRNGNTINLTASVSIDQVLVESGATLNATGGTLTVADGVGTDLTVSGVFISRVAINKVGTIQFTSSGKYVHNFTTTSGTIPTAIWDAGSVCEISGYSSFTGTVLGSDQSFSDFLWNATNQAGSSKPVLASPFSARNFTVSSTGSGNGSVGFAGTVGISGNWSSTGGNVDLTTNNPAITFNGTTQNIAANTLNFQNVTFANSGTKTLSNGSFSVAATGKLNMAGTSILNANGNLKLLSNSSSSATVTTIPAGASIIGNVTVQRFVNGGTKVPYRTWRMFSSPIAGFNYTQLIDNIFITGPNGPANGFDDSPNSGPSAFRYDADNGGFIAVANINESVLPGKGIYLTYRGDRSNPGGKILTTVDNAVDPESTIVDFVGVLNQQNVSVTSLSGNGANLLGNPYASTIDWTKVDKSGLQGSTIRIWNPSNRNYALYDDGSITPASSLNGGSQYIPSGQGFFVARGSYLTFTESVKDNAQPVPLLLSLPVGGELQLKESFVGKSGESVMAGGNSFTAATEPFVKLKLTKAATPYTDEIVLSMKPGKSANYILGEDIVSFGGSEISLASLSANNVKLAVNVLPEIALVNNVKLVIGGEPSSKGVSKSGDYNLLVNYNNLPADYIIQVKDNFTNTTTAVANGGNYSFNVNEAIAASTGADRLSISFVAPTSLPVTITSFKATKSVDGVVLKWATSSEVNNNRFEIERAGEDGVFKTILNTNAKGVGSYQLLDKTPLLGNNYYKLRQVDNDETISYHNKIEVVNFNGVNAAALSVFPNPATDKFTVKYDGSLESDKQIIKVISTSGQVLLSKIVTKAALNNGVEINIANLSAGVYLVNVIDGNNNKKIDLSKLIKL